MKILCIGEILMRLSTRENERFAQAKSFDINYGGSEANVAIALAQLGFHAAVLTRLPQNPIGDTINGMLKQFSVDTTEVLRGGDKIGTYFLEEGTDIRSSQIIYDRANSAISDIDPDMLDWNTTLKGVNVLHWSGISPGISLNMLEVCQRAIQEAKARNIFISADLHYRINLWNFGQQAHEVMPAMIAQSDLIVGDPFTLEKLTGMDLGIGETPQLSTKTIGEAFEKFSEHFTKIKHMAMLSREIVSSSHNVLQGVLLSGQDLKIASQIEVRHIRDRIGGGDAFMAGLLFAHFSKRNAEQSINFATAASALKHTIKGDYLLSSEEEIDTLLNSKIKGAIKR